MGEWSSVDDRRWNIEDATVACRQLGYSKAVSNVVHVARSADYSSYVIVKSRVDDVRCRGNEINLRHCLFEVTLNQYYRSYDAAGATCGKIM